MRTMTDRERANHLETLLWKYAEHVDRCEGVNFLGESHRSQSVDLLSDEEWAELCAIARRKPGVATST